MRFPRLALRPVAMGCLAMALAACHPTPKAPSSAAISTAPTGTIPLTSRSDKAIALYLQGRAANERLQPHEGHALFQQAMEIDPTFAMGEYGLAATAPTALETRVHANKALALSTTASDGERLLIRAMQARLAGEPALVKTLAESLVTRFPLDARAHWVLGNSYTALESHVRAAEQFQRAIAIDPQFALAYNSLGYAHRAAGNMPAAEEAFREYIALVPNDPNPHDSYAELLMVLGRFDESIIQYNKALAIDPHFSGSFVGLAADHLFAGRSLAAVAAAERYLGVARDDHERRAALLTLALVHVDRGATDDAVSAMERSYGLARAIGDTASMAMDAIAMGDILVEAGRADAAQARYTSARALAAASSLSPNLKRDAELAAHGNLVRVALVRHNVAGAQAEAETFRRGAAGTGSAAQLRQAHALTGLVALEAKQFDSALSEFAEADRQDPQVLYAMGQAYYGKGDRANGDYFAATALHMYPLPTFPLVFVRAQARVQQRLQAPAPRGGSR